VFVSKLHFTKGEALFLGSFFRFLRPRKFYTNKSQARIRHGAWLFCLAFGHLLFSLDGIYLTVI